MGIRALFGILSTISGFREPKHCVLRWVLTAKPSNADPIGQRPWWGLRNLSDGKVSVVVSGGKAKFKITAVDPEKKMKKMKKEIKWIPKLQLKSNIKKEKERRRAANPNRPSNIFKFTRRKFHNPVDRILYSIKMAKHKETLLIKKLKQFEVPQVQGPVVEPVKLTEEERFFLTKMSQKKSNYAPIGRRGVFGGVILNMHMHWKRHETVRVICNRCQTGLLQVYAKEIARLSGGVPLRFIGKDTIVFYRGKGYVRPEVMSPIDTLSKKKAMEKSKYEQSLDSVRVFIFKSEKELEVVRRYIALYGDQTKSNPISIVNDPRKVTEKLKTEEKIGCASNGLSTRIVDMEVESAQLELSETDNDFDYCGSNGLSTSESNSEDVSHLDFDSDD